MRIVTRPAPWTIVAVAILASSSGLHSIRAAEPAAVDCIVGGVPKPKHEVKANHTPEEEDQITEWALQRAQMAI